MEIENYYHGGGGGGYRNKLSYNRSGPTSRPQNKVCIFWQSGRCNRDPCQFMHELPFDHTRTHMQIRDPSSFKRPHHQNLVWINPATGANKSKWDLGRHRDNTNANTVPGRLNGERAGTSVGSDRLCKFFLSDSCSFGDKCRFSHAWSVGDGFSLVTPLKGHEKAVTAIALPSGGKLYSGSKDMTIKVWDCETGQCAATISTGCEVGCMISEEAWLFVGIPDSIKVWNTKTGIEMTLPGPVGQVYALVAANDMLFAGTQDSRILVWRFNVATNCFEPATSLVGHRLAVISLAVGGARLYSGSMDNTIKAWDLSTLQCIQTISDHSNAVMSLLYWDQFLLSCSLDNTVKVWFTNNQEQLEVTYTHTEEHGIISLCGMHDVQGKPVLLCSLNDNSVHIYDLPSFNERGRIFAKQEIRAMQTGPTGLFFTGDGTGELKVWKWCAI
ncbi:zinc finger WD40 repeat protein 1 [Rhynchospora pubera]|uniref:Zinc finger WD40 repeat protein 1 n=1 Tax=Rhynchospora pubera TaxID=906938 RepID=A0AAV8FI92_9POAL|nr:zinc finger WD40 repeat protein 1 [Rhynchospora pubera]